MALPGRKKKKSPLNFLGEQISKAASNAASRTARAAASRLRPKSRQVASTKQIKRIVQQKKFLKEVKRTLAYCERELIRSKGRFNPSEKKEHLEQIVQIAIQLGFPKKEILNLLRNTDYNFKKTLEILNTASQLRIPGKELLKRFRAEGLDMAFQRMQMALAKLHQQQQEMQKKSA